MAHLYKHLRIHQVFGANTEVGKTILTTALCRTSAGPRGSTSRTTGNSVYYVKPVSTGPMTEADASHVARFSGPYQPQIHPSCLFQLEDPVSPHLAVQRTSQKIAPSDISQLAFINRVSEHLHGIASKISGPSSLYVETAGGVHSPSLSGLSQAEAYRPLFLPTILIGDSRLGGISSTISAYESLLLRGYSIDAILLFREMYYRNWEYLNDYFGKKGIHVQAVSPPPSRQADPNADFAATETYYRDVCGEQGGKGEEDMIKVVQHLDAKHAERLSTLESMPKRTLESVWWPFVQHKTVGGETGVTVIDSAHGDLYSTFTTAPTSDSSSNTTFIADTRSSDNQSLLSTQFDGSASWWTQAIGHASSELTQAAAAASGRYGHVIFPLAIHEPALKLTERLLGRGGPGHGWADKVFFTDNGSTGMEVALKMALRTTALRHRGLDPALAASKDKLELGIIGISGSYHGDTIGAMDAAEGGVYNSSVEWHRGRGYWFEPPRVGVRNGKVVIDVPAIRALGSSSSTYEFDGPDALQRVYDVESRIGSDLGGVYRRWIRDGLSQVEKETLPFSHWGALVLEPIVMGAGGMIFVDPLFQRLLVDEARAFSPKVAKGASPTDNGAYVGSWTGLPVVFDEVFTGLHRLGPLSPSLSILRTAPDVLVLAKILTGGLLPLSVTLTTKSIYEAFLGDEKVQAMLHGHSYTAHPIGSAVAGRALELVEEVVHGEEWAGAKSQWANATKQGEEKKEPWVYSLWSPEFVMEVSKNSQVEEVMAMGTVLAIRLLDDNAGYQAASSQRLLDKVKEHLRTRQQVDPSAFGLHFRPLGNVAYLMSSLNTPQATLRTLEQGIFAALES